VSLPSFFLTGWTQLAIVGEQHQVKSPNLHRLHGDNLLS
jgi:hypothetical protein